MPASRPEAPTSTPVVFISYSEKDREWRDQLAKFLSPAVQAGRIVVSDYAHSSVAEDWTPKTPDLANVSVAVLLITPDYLASKRITEVEIPRFKQLMSQMRAVIPVLVRTSHWGNINWLGELPIFPPDGKSIRSRSHAQREQIFKTLANLIEYVIQRSASSSTFEYLVEEEGVGPKYWRYLNRELETLASDERVPLQVSKPAPAGSRPPASSTKPQPPTTFADLAVTPLSISALSGFVLSNEAQASLVRARVLATFTGRKPGKVSTSTLLFGIAEGGRGDASFFRTPQFLWKELRRKSAKTYSSVFSEKFPEAIYDSTDETINFESITDLAQLITPNTLRVFTLAREISKTTLSKSPSPSVQRSKGSVPESFPGHIGTRHLLAALLILDLNDGPASGVLARLERMVGYTTSLRKRFLDFIVENLPDDDEEAWRKFLLPRTSAEMDDPVVPPTGSIEPQGIGGDEVDKNFRAPVAGFLTDNWSGADLLDITPDVNALASLVAAWSVEPPLSIGLFGDWGSGKTHFMRQMRARVDKLSRRARGSADPQNKIGYYKNIVQIEFNAWHYIEGNLWASLVEHIFRNLRICEEDDEATLKNRQDKLLQDLLGEEVKAKVADEELKAAESKVLDKQTTIKGIQKQQQEKIEALATLSKQDVLASVQLSVVLDDVTQGAAKEALETVGVTAAGSAARDVQAALSEAHSIFGQAGGLLTPLLKARDGKKRFTMLLLIVVGAPIVGLAIGLLMKFLAPQISNLSAFLTTAATLMSTGAVWIRRQVRWVAEWSQKVEKARQEVDRQIDEKVATQRAENAEQIASYQEELKTLQTNLAASIREREAAQQRVQKVRDEIKQDTVVERLGKFIQDRAASDDYRKHLGVLALIRRDFEKLARLFGKQREAEQLGNSIQDPETINRIILYIDDLDRCPPERVVQVLQAIHLLLAFNLFVVVVGVDSRWVTRSLQESYEWLRAEEDEENKNKEEKRETGPIQGPTPHDYLEKIFQIPFWLKPMGPTECESLLDGLTQSSRSKAVIENEGAGGDGKDHAQTENAKPVPPIISEPGAVSPPDGARAEVDPSTESPEKPQANVPTPVEIPAHIDATIEHPEPAGNLSVPPGESHLNTGNASSASAVPEDHEEIDLAPLSLKLTDDEINYMKHLTPLIGRSPRAVKRFLNCYRLIKVSYSSHLTKLMGASGKGGDYRSVMLLLGIITGSPSMAVYFIEELEKQIQQGPKGKSSLQTLIARLDKNADVKLQPDWARVKDFVEANVGNDPSKATFAGLVSVTQQVSRYSFRVARAEASRQRRREPGTKMMVNPTSQRSTR
jgi:predicted KAP-like P-loop ATPase